MVTAFRLLTCTKVNKQNNEIKSTFTARKEKCRIYEIFLGFEFDITKLILKKKKKKKATVLAIPKVVLCQ